MNAELKVAEPLRSRLILEMAGDLEAMADHFRARGMTEAQAVAEAEERLLTSPRAIEALVRVHTTGFERVAMRVAGAVRTGLDLLLFILGIVPLMLAAGFAVMNGMTRDGLGTGAWIILAMGALLLVLSARAGWLLQQRRADRYRIHRAVGDILYLALFTLTLGATAFTLGLIHTFGLMSRMGTGASTQMVAGSLAGTAATLALSLLIAVGGGLIWIVLVSRQGASEQAESAALLAA